MRRAWSFSTCLDHMTTYELKVWPKYWADIADGRKNFDIRQGEDRQYQVGDWLILKEWDPFRAVFTGRQTRRRIGYIMHGGDWLPSETWVLGFES